MATFYGQVEGMAPTRGSRCGSYASHIRSSVQHNDGSIIFEMFKPSEDPVLIEDADELWLQVYYHSKEDGDGRKHPGFSFTGQTIFRGSLDRFVDMCRREFE